MTVTVRVIRDDAERQAAYALRREVFVAEQGVPAELELDERDAHATHLVAVQDGAVVGTARLIGEDDAIRFGRLAVARDARRRGIAGELLAAAAHRARGQGFARIVLSAQTCARGLYEAAGYVERGEVYLEAGIEHVAMELHLA